MAKPILISSSLSLCRSSGSGFYNIGVYTPIELLEESKINWQVLLKIRRLWLVTTPSVTLDDANVHCIRIDEVGHSPSSVLDWERVLGTTS